MKAAANTPSGELVRWITFIILGTSWLGLLNGPAVAAEKRNQLEELLIWKMSDELKLTPIEEKKFSNIVKEISKKKSESHQAQQAAVEKMSQGLSAKLKEEQLVAYRKSLVAYSRALEQEFDSLKGLLGSERMTKYLVIKQDLTNRIKNMITNPEATKKMSAPLPPPKIIEEK